MSSQITINSPLSTTELTITKTKPTTRTGTESQKWRSRGGLSVGKGRGRMEGEAQGIRSITDRHKIDRKWLRIV